MQRAVHVPHLPIALALAASVWAPPAVIAAEPLTPETLNDEHVQKAIGAMVEELYRRKDPTRFWNPGRIPKGESTRQEGGYTAFVLLALTSAGESYQNPRLRDAVEHLRGVGMRGTYAVTLRAAVWAKLSQKFIDDLAADTKWLLDGFSERSRGWEYVQKPFSRKRDNSITQFGALALWEAAKRGIKVEKRYWQMLEDGFIESQLENGGWDYDGDGDVRGSMVAAGLATLFITQDFLHREDALKLGRTGRAPNLDAIERGLAWMNKNFLADDNPGKPGYYYFYYAYGIERVGLASGLRFFGGRDWYRECAAEIIDRLCTWNPDDRTMEVRGQGNRLDATMLRQLSFAIMFLSRGRVPVAINKLEVDGYPWNNRPRDAANLTRWLTNATESELNWRIVNLASAPEDWLDAPMVYLASNQPLPFIKALDFDPEIVRQDMRDYLERRAAGTIPASAPPPQIPSSPELRKIKRYLDLGGMLFAAREGSSPDFARSVEDLGTLLYPQYDWRTLPEDHWAYRLHVKVPKGKPKLRALSNGVRELIVLSPSSDLPATFQARAESSPEHLDLAANLYFYASELNRPRPRLARHVYHLPTSERPQESVTIVRALHGGNWNPEPQALPSFGRYLANEKGIHVNIVDQPLHAIDEIEPAPTLVIVSGVDALEFNEKQAKAVERYVQSGGFILFETPGGSGAFLHM